MSNGDRNITWLPPLFTNAGGADVVVGVTSDPEWFTQYHTVVSLSGDRLPPSILPLVQPGYGGDYPAARNLITSRLETAGLPSSLVDTFPFFAVIALAFRSSGFWAAHAVAWVPHLNFDESFANVLLRFTLDKQNSQSDRHLVAKHLRKWETDRGITLLRP
ncbi:MAG: hypothetical protein WBH28_00860 [Fuerstiella sp.]